MKANTFIWGIVLLSLMFSVSAQAVGSQAGANYNCTTESADGGGQRTTSADYISDSSFGAGSFVASANYAQRGGFAGQLNNPPVARVTTVNRNPGAGLVIAVADLATNWSDVDGYAVALAGVNLTSTNEVQLVVNSDGIFYTNNLNLNDRFNYTIIDGQGESALGTVVVVPTTEVVVGQPKSITMDGGTVTILFVGNVEGYSYKVQRTTNLLTSQWVTIGMTNAPVGGAFQFNDNFGDLGGVPPPAAFYRLSSQ